MKRAKHSGLFNRYSRYYVTGSEKTSTFTENIKLSKCLKFFCILVIVMLSSILATGIVQDTFAGEGGEGERGRRS